MNHCPFCLVPRKEGKLQKVGELREFWNGQKKIMLLDNCLTDYKEAIPILSELRDLNVKLNLTQGFNIRTITPRVANIFAEIKLWRNKQWHIAWDHPKDETKVFEGIRVLNSAGIKNWKIMICLKEYQKYRFVILPILI